jgi:hypothetical protein
MSLPLTLPAFVITNTLTVQVTISPDYYTASVNFISGGSTVFQQALTKAAPNVTLTPGIDIGSLNISTGSLHMAIPGAINPGNIQLSLNAVDMSNGNQPVIVNNNQIASWSLNQ